MKMEMMLVLSRDEVQRDIPYAMICETRFGSAWGTGRRRRRWLAEFSEKEREAATRLFNQSHQWYLTTGVPDEVKMTTKTLDLWQKLGAFCASI